MKTCSLRGRACSHAPPLVATPSPPAHAPFPWWPRPSPPAHAASPGGHAPFPWWPHPPLSWPCSFSPDFQNRRLGQHPPLASAAPPLSLLQEQKRLQLLHGISMTKVSWIWSHGRCPRMLQENRSEMQRHQETPARPAHNTPALFRGLQPSAIPHLLFLVWVHTTCNLSHKISTITCISLASG